MRIHPMSLLNAALLTSGSAHAAFLPTLPREAATYHLTYAGDATVDPGAALQPGANRQTVASRLVTDLDIVPLDAHRFALRLKAPRYRLQVGASTSDLSAALASLEQPSVLETDASGRVRGIAAPAAAPAIAQGVLRAVVSNLQFVRGDGAAAGWRAVQDTANGPARVAYRSLGPGVCERRIVDYVQTRSLGPKGDPALRHLPEGALRYTFAGGRLQSVDGAITTRSSVNGRFLSDTLETVSLQRRSTRRLSDAVLKGWAIPRGPLAPLSAAERDPMAQQASWRQALGDATPLSLAAALAALDRSSRANDPQLYAQLCAVFSLDPRAAATILRSVSGRRPQALSLRLCAAALGAVAGAPSCAPGAAEAAEAALRRLLEARSGESDAVQVLAPNLAMTVAPHGSTWTLLERLSRSADPETAGPATLALGGLARHCPATERARLIRGLTARLKSNTDATTVLAALGNAGRIESFAAVAGLLRSSSPQTRAAAALSLRFVPGGSATQALLRTLRDGDPVVRTNAARALKFRPFGAAEVAAVRAAAVREPVAAVRLTLLENLYLELPYHPSLRSTLSDAAAKDRAQEVRATVGRWLAR